MHSTKITKECLFLLTYGINKTKKVSRLVLKELSQIFNVEANNILGPIMISITAVRISPDLAYANIFLSIFPVNDPEKALEKIIKNSSLIKRN